MKDEIGALVNEVKDFATEAKSRIEGQDERIATIERSLSKSSIANFDMTETKSLGELVTSAEQTKTFLHDRLPRSGKVSIGGSFFKTAIVSDGSLFTQPYRVPGISAVTQRLTIRDLLRTSPTTSNLVEYVKEISSTNAAAPQGKGSSPQVFENVAKAESALGFQLFSEAVVTLAHWIPASKQVLDDGPPWQPSSTLALSIS